MPAIHARVPPAPFRHGRDSRSSPALPAQCTFPRSPDARSARGDSRWNVRRLARRLDRALPLRIINRMTVLALLQAAAAPRSNMGSLFFVVQIALILAIFYFLMIRPQQKQRKQHESTLMQLKKGDDI